MFDRKKCLDSFYNLLRVLPDSESENYLEVYLSNGKKIYLKVEVTNAPEVQIGRRLMLVKNDSSSEGD